MKIRVFEFELRGCLYFLYSNFGKIHEVHFQHLLFHWKIEMIFILNNIYI